MNKLLSRYFQENFFIIPIRKNDKRPIYKQWNEYSLSYMETRQWIIDGYNIAVVAKDLYILDYDRKETVKEKIDWYREFGTITQFSPRGYHLFFKSKENLSPKELVNLFLFMFPRHGIMKEPETIRHGDMYTLIAPSKIDGKSYWWLDDMKGEILTL